MPPTSPKRDVGFSASGSYHSPQACLGDPENRRKAGGAEKCKRLRIFINPTPRVGRGRYQTPKKLHQGNSPWVLLSRAAQPRTPGHCAQQDRLCQQEPSTQPAGIPVCLSLLAMAVGCQFLLIQVGWESSLIFDFKKLVRIYFFCLCSVSTYVDYYKLM